MSGGNVDARALGGVSRIEAPRGEPELSATSLAGAKPDKNCACGGGHLFAQQNRPLSRRRQGAHRSLGRVADARDNFNNLVGYHVAAYDAVFLAQNVPLAQFYTSKAKYEPDEFVKFSAGILAAMRRKEFFP